MKISLKTLGVLAITLALTFNLQYALLDYDLKNSPNSAMAAWVDSDTGVTYCGSPDVPPYLRTLAGTWYYTPGGYDIYTFEANNWGTQCGRFTGDTTSIIPNGTLYQY